MRLTRGSKGVRFQIELKGVNSKQGSDVPFEYHNFRLYDGEEDEFLKRGRPLFLSQSRYGALSEMWLHSAFDYDTLALHSSRVGSDFY